MLILGFIIGWIAGYLLSEATYNLQCKLREYKAIKLARSHDYEV